MLYQELLETIKTIPVVDTHEHLEPEGYRVRRKIDLFQLFMTHYASSDLISAGMPQNEMNVLRSADADIDTKWNLFEPYWEKTRNTAYCRALKIAVQDLYGVEDLDRDSYTLINQQMVDNNQKGIYEAILKEKANIKYCIWDNLWRDDPDRKDFMKHSVRLDDFIFINRKEDIEDLERKSRMSIHSLSDIETAMRKYIEDRMGQGMVAFKCGLAYLRTLKFEQEDASGAAKALEDLLKGDIQKNDRDRVKVLQDYMMHKALALASELRIPYQFHTGLQEGNGNFIDNANPAHLTHLIMKYPKVKFDLFHGGYPFGGQLSVLAKNFPNVYVDMCWLHIISPEYSRRYLAEWLDTVPANKIFGFGGDFIFAEGSYGHLCMARQNIAKTLAIKIEEGVYTKKEALSIAKKILHDNPMELFQLAE